MDLSDITDIDRLKSLAYDRLAAIEQAQKDLQMINARIIAVSQGEPTAAPDEPAAADGDSKAEETPPPLEPGV